MNRQTTQIWVKAFQRRYQALHDAYKTFLMREILRVKSNIRRELDVRHLQAIEDIADIDRAIPRIILHVRRTDKIGTEAELVKATVFVAALKHILFHKDPKGFKCVLQIVSDESQVEQEMKDALADEPDVVKAIERMQFRFAPSRPDRTQTHEELDDVFWQLLVDLRLFIAGDIFVGSQSS